MIDLEDGYLKIANELFEQIIKFDFSKRELKIVLAVIRKTYGFNKKSDQISLSQLVKLTSLNKANISRTVANLATMQVLKINNDNYIQVIELNKYYRKWVAKAATVAKTTTKGCQNGNSTVAKMATTKDTLTKDNIKTKAAAKKSATYMPENWSPNKNNCSWLIDSGLSDLEQQKIIRDFRDFWILSETRRANWDLSFRKNPLVKSFVNRIKNNLELYEKPWKGGNVL